MGLFLLLLSVNTVYEVHLSCYSQLLLMMLRKILQFFFFLIGDIMPPEILGLSFLQ